MNTAVTSEFIFTAGPSCKFSTQKKGNCLAGQPSKGKMLQCKHPCTEQVPHIIQSPPADYKASHREHLTSRSSAFVSVASEAPAAECDSTSHDARLRHAHQANRRKREVQTCHLCHSKMVDTIFLPCGHIITCQACAASVGNCTICHSLILGTVHVYTD